MSVASKRINETKNNEHSIENEQGVETPQKNHERNSKNEKHSNENKEDAQTHQKTHEHSSKNTTKSKKP